MKGLLAVLVFVFGLWALSSASERTWRVIDAPPAVAKVFPKYAYEWRDNRGFR